MEIKGKIQGKTIDEGIGKNGKPYKRAVFQVNDKKYSTFDEDLRKGFEVGDSVKITGQQEGKYFNMENMVKIKANEVSTQDNSGSNDIFEVNKKILAVLLSIEEILEAIENGKSSK